MAHAKGQDTRGSPLGRVFASACCLCLLLVVCRPCPSSAASQAPTRAEQAAQHKAEDKLGSLCRRVASIKRLSEMQELIETLVEVLSKRGVARSLAPGGPVSAPSMLASNLVASTYGTPLRFFHQNPTAACVAQAAAILDLGELISERSNVCSSDHLDKIERYRERHLKAYYAYGELAAACKQRLAGLGGVGTLISGDSACVAAIAPTKPITAKFFQLYANQVAFVCKSNLLHSLHVVDDSNLLKPGDFDKVTPWLGKRNSELCKRVEELIEGAGGSELNGAPTRLAEATGQQLPGAHNGGGGSEVGVSRDEFRQCNARKLLMDLSNIDELVEVMESSEKRPETGPLSSLFLIVSDNQKQMVDDLLTTCAKLRPIYEQTVMPIARLARLGFSPAHTNFDKVCSSNTLIKRWFSLTLVCNSMLSSRMPSDREKYSKFIKDNNMGQKSFVVVDEEEEEHKDEHQDEDEEPGHKDKNGHEEMTEFVAEPIDRELLANLIKNPIEDELWIYKYGTTKLQRIRDNVIKKVFKLLKVEDINSHIVFRKRMAHTGRWIVRVLLISLALVTFDRAVVI